MIPVLIGLGVLIGGIVAVANWDEIKDWLNDFIPKLKKAWASLKTKIANGAMIVAEKVKEAGKWISKIMHKLYYKNEQGQWVEETTTRVLPESEVPPFIRAKIQREEQEVDITEEMERELKLEIQ